MDKKSGSRAFTELHAQKVGQFNDEIYPFDHILGWVFISWVKEIQTKGFR